MSNSSLICKTIPSPNCTKGRKHAIDTITIHCMAGNATIEACGQMFARKSRKASSNYGIGSDGRIALYVNECDRSWCTSSSANDNRAITIEVANNGGAPDWPVSAKAYAALIDLVEDICRRNGIKKLVWSTLKNDRVKHLNGCNMTVHRDYAAKACPGNYLYERHGEIAAAVNARLGAADAGDGSLPQSPAATAPSSEGASGKTEVPYRVRVTADVLNIRKGPGTGFDVCGRISNRGVYTIVEEAEGAGAAKWGQLKSGAGWISLDYVKMK